MGLMGSPTIEFLKDQKTGSRTGRAWLEPCMFGADRAGFVRKETIEYQGDSKWLTVVGIGDPRYHEARDLHLSKGLPAACWDMGYIGKTKNVQNCYVRVSYCTDHPTFQAIETTEPDPSRFVHLGVYLRDDSDPNGHVLVIGMGPKAHQYIGEPNWEIEALRAAERRFPNRRIVYRPKPRRHNYVPVDWPNSADFMPIAQALKGASLVICRHSNVAIDACIAGIPVECESGAAHWLYSRHTHPSLEQRRQFLFRLAWWQYRLVPHDMERAWRFLLSRESILPIPVVEAPSRIEFVEPA